MLGDQFGQDRASSALHDGLCGHSRAQNMVGVTIQHGVYMIPVVLVLVRFLNMVWGEVESVMNQKGACQVSPGQLSLKLAL